jgi:ABC-type transport system involved in multi-copper enzyme maturation permease subunit
VSVIAPYEPAVRPARPPGFGALLHAEWTKLRTVRGWVIGLLVAVLLPVGITFLGHQDCGIVFPNGQTLGCPGLPTGPGGGAVEDSFYFVHQPLPADGSIIARVTSLTGLYSLNGGNSVGTNGQLTGMATGTQPWSKAGIMIKASTTPGSAYAAMLVTGSNGVRMQWNYTGDTAGQPGTVSGSSPRWLKLTRTGSVVTGYDSVNGTSWTEVGSQTLKGLPSSGAVQVGLFATSPDYQVITQSFGGGSSRGGHTLATGAFEDVSVSGATVSGAAVSGSAAGTPWASTSVGYSPPLVAPGTPKVTAKGGDPFMGSFTQTSASSFTVTGSGDIAPDVLDSAGAAGTSPQSVLIGMFAALIVVIIVAALFVAAEYRRAMIRVTFAAAPSRWQVLAAKSVVIGVVSFVVGLVAVGVILPVGLRRLRSEGNWIPPISPLTEGRMIVGTALLLAVSAILALAIGAMARRSVLAIAGVIVVIFIPFMLAHVPGILPVSVEDWLLRVTPTAAFSIQQAYPGYHQVAAPYLAADGYYPLLPWAGFAVLCAWAAVALTGAAWLLRRRDA